MSDTDEYDHVRRVGGNERVSEAVLQAVSAVTGRPPLELPPLQRSVDVDALNRLFAAPTTVDSLRFTYAGHEVLVEPGHVHVRDRR
jgi:hypothetical protein